MLCLSAVKAIVGLFVLSKSKWAGKPFWGFPALITHQQRRARLSTAALEAPFILTVDWLDWLCYFRSYASAAYTQQDTLKQL